MIDGARIEMLLERRGMSQSGLARAVGVSQQTIWKLINGHAAGSKHIMQIARVLETSPDFLLKETDDPAALPGQVATTSTEEDIVEIRELDLAFGMGGGSYLELPVKPKPRKFDREWLRLFSSSPANRLFMARGIGDSMSPTIMNADIVIIDTADNRVRMADQIWAIAYGETGMIKRLRPMPDGGVKILSDNAAVPPETAYDGEMHVVGKVVTVIRRMSGV